MPTGTVKFYDRDRGCGYLVPDDGSPEVAVSADALHVTDGLRTGQRVWYELTRGADEELRALNVVPTRDGPMWR